MKSECLTLFLNKCLESLERVQIILPIVWVIMWFACPWHETKHLTEFRLNSTPLPWHCGTRLSLWLRPLWLSWSWEQQCVQLVERKNTWIILPLIPKEFSLVKHSVMGLTIYHNWSLLLPFPFFCEPGVSFTLCLWIINDLLACALTYSLSLTHRKINSTHL